MRRSPPTLLLFAKQHLSQQTVRSSARVDPSKRVHCPACSTVQGFLRSAKLSSQTGTNNNISPSDAGRASFALRSQLDDQLKDSNAMGEVLSMSTLLSHAGLSRGGNSANDNAPLSPPIELSSTYERPPDGDYGENGLIYSRSNNPTRTLLEEAMGQLEMAGSSSITTTAPTFAFSSGMAAVASVLLAHTSPVKLLIPKDVYHGVPTQLHTSLNDHGVVHEAVDMTNINDMRQKMEECMKLSSEKNKGNDASLIVWMETPSNPLCQVTDIRELCNAVNECRGRYENVRITTVVDSTWAPPCITQPLLVSVIFVFYI